MKLFLTWASRFSIFPLVCLGCTVRTFLFPKGLYDSICLVMKLFSLFLMCDLSPPTPTKPYLPPLLLLYLYQFLFDGFPEAFSLKAIRGGEVQQLKMKSYCWRYKKSCSKGNTVEILPGMHRALLFLSRQKEKKPHFSDVGGYFLLEWSGMRFRGENLARETTVCWLEPSPESRIKLWDKNIEEYSTG